MKDGECNCICHYWGNKNFLCSDIKSDEATDSAAQEPLSPSSIGSSQSLPSDRVVDGSSDNCSIVSNDVTADGQEVQNVSSSRALGISQSPLGMAAPCTDLFKVCKHV